MILQIGLRHCPWKTLQDTLIPDHSAMDASNDSALGLRVKSTLVLTEAVRAANGILGRSKQFYVLVFCLRVSAAGRNSVKEWTEVPTLDAMISVFLDTMPRNETAYSIVSNVPLKPLLARTALSSLCAAVIIFGIGAESDTTIYARRLAAARWMASLYRELQSYPDHPYRYICSAVSS